MGKILVIIESKGKIKCLEAALGPKYKIVASAGHILDLPVKKKTKDGKLAVDIDNNFEPYYIPKDDQSDTIKMLKREAKAADDILLAADEDREGEMIAWSYAKVLGIKKPKRMVYNSVSKTALLTALKNIGDIDQAMVDAQKTRRILDRLVGYDTTGLVRAYNNAESAGRVQSVILRLIVDKEAEVTNFMENKQCSQFKFSGSFYMNNADLDADNCLASVLYENKKKSDMVRIDNKKDARKLHKDCTKSKYKVTDVNNKKSRRNPPAPFTTSTMQQEAGRKLGMGIDATMMAAKKLYESGKITYLRTDSVHLAPDALKMIKDCVVSKYGEKHYREMKYKQKKGNAQEAHEAVRPTNMNTVKVNDGDNNASRLYSLIWKRTIASQMNPAEYDVVDVTIKGDKIPDYHFKSTIQKLTYEGYLMAYNIKAVEKDDDEDDEDTAFTGKVPKVGDKINAHIMKAKEEYNKPPSRFNEVSLIKILDIDQLNIGRPATTPNLIKKLITKKYAEIKDVDGVKKKICEMSWKEGGDIEEKKSDIVIGAEKKKFIPTNLGLSVTDYLVKNLPDILDYKFTSKMEDKLDAIANGELVWYEVLQEFYDEFGPKVKELKKSMVNKKNDTIRELGKDTKTGGTVYAMQGKFSDMVQLILNDKVLNQGPIRKPLTHDKITLKQALEILKYPIILGKIGSHDVKLYDGKQIDDNKYPPYVVIGKRKLSVPNLDVTLDTVKDLLKEADKNLLHTVGTKEYRLMESKIGNNKYYIMIIDRKSKKRINLSIPDTVDATKLSLEDIDKMIDEKYNKRKKEGGGKKPEKKPVKKPVKIVKK